MSLSLRALFLFPLFVCLGAFAAPPVVTFEPGNVYATVAPGHSVAWSTVHYWNGTSGYETDSDNDGRVRLGSRLDMAWIVVDTDTGEWTSGGVTTSSLPSRTIVRGTSGTYSTIYATGMTQFAGIPLWVRPGVGAWAVLASYPSTVFHADGAIIDALQLKKLGTSPAIPSGFERGDLLFLLNPSTAQTGLVDSQLDDPPAPGYFEMDWPTGVMAQEQDTIRGYVVRRGGTNGTASVRWTVSGTAEAGIDYAALGPVEVVFGPGETAKPFALPLQDDGAYNPAGRNVVLTLSDPTGGATLGARIARTHEIADDDPPPVLAFGAVPSSVVEGDTSWMLDVPFSVTGAFRGSLPVLFSANSVTVGTFAVTPAQTQLTAKAPIDANDNIADLPRTISLSLYSPAPRMLSPTRTVEIIDDDPPRVVIDDVTVDEEHGAYLVIRPEWLPSAEGTVSWNTVDGTARAGEDYVAKSGVSTVTRWSNGAISLALISDEAAEGPETFYLEVTSVSGPLLPPVRMRIAITLIDDDMPPPAVIVETTSVTEGNIDKDIPLRVRLATPSTSIVWLRFNAAADGTATPFKDFYPPNLMSFQPGETTKDTTMRVYGDEVGEPDETATIEVMDKNFKVIGTTTVTILDDDRDTWPMVSISAPATLEGNAGLTVVPVKVRLATALPMKVKMALWSAHGTATAEDYLSLSTAVTFLAGETEQEFSLVLLGDTLVEGDETITLKTTYSGTDIASATMTILDDDDEAVRPTLTIGDVEVRETGGREDATFTLRLSKASSETVKVSYATADESAKSASDYEHRAGTVTFAPGQTIQTIVIPVEGDELHEETETFTVWLSNGDGVMIPDVRAICTIVDDDDPQEEKRTKRRSARH